MVYSDQNFESLFQQLYSDIYLEAEEIKTHIMVENIYPKVEEVLSTPVGDRRFKQLVGNFIDRNNEKLHTSGPVYMIPFADRDKADFFPTGSILPTDVAEYYSTTGGAVGNRLLHAHPPVLRILEKCATGCHNKPIPDSPAHAVPASPHLATPNCRLHTHISLPSAHDKDSPANS